MQIKFFFFTVRVGLMNIAFHVSIIGEGLNLNDIAHHLGFFLLSQILFLLLRLTHLGQQGLSHITLYFLQNVIIFLGFSSISSARLRI